MAYPHGRATRVKKQALVVLSSTHVSGTTLHLRHQPVLRPLPLPLLHVLRLPFASLLFENLQRITLLASDEAGVGKRVLQVELQVERSVEQTTWSGSASHLV